VNLATESTEVTEVETINFRNSKALRSQPCCHSREGGNPFNRDSWIPRSIRGMTKWGTFIMQETSSGIIRSFSAYSVAIMYSVAACPG
jgi:hypothetical protein